MSRPGESVREMLGSLVGFDTVSRNSNLSLIEFVARYLRDLGVEARLVRSEDGAKANLVASLGPPGPGGVMLTGHSDVVPVDGQPWSSDPFALRESEGRLYGRGTADMKGFLATALALVPEFLAAGLRQPLHLALTYDEETTCAGARRMVPELVRLGIRPHAVIVGEPTRMRLVGAHKGYYSLRTRVLGRPAHSSLSHAGVSAISLAARLIGFLEGLAQELARDGRRMEHVMPPFTTLNVGTIAGGTQRNIIARECAFAWEVRPVPGEDARALIARFERYAAEQVEAERARFPEVAVHTELERGVDALEAQPDSPAQALVRALTGENASAGVAYFTEAPFFQKAEFSTVVFGPGSIEQAHRPDEYIELAQLGACEEFMRALARHLARPLPAH